jgi:hypothetical protein
MFITLKSQSRKSRAKGEMEQVTTKDASTGNVVAQTHSTKRRPACVACQRRKVSCRAIMKILFSGSRAE